MLTRQSRHLGTSSARLVHAPKPALHRDCSRSITHGARQLQLIRGSLRPQLPYLAQPTFQRRLSPIDRHVLRLLSTESRQTVRDYAWLTVKWTTITWTVLFLLNIMAFGISIEVAEHSNPTPAEWTFWSRQAMRKAKVEIEALNRQGFIDWNAVAVAYLEVIRLLEKEIIDHDHVGEKNEPAEKTFIAGLGAAGHDISEKSWSWRQGYFEALMGAAQASENLDDMVRDTTRNLIFPKSTIIGPSNPDPRPVSKTMESAPLEEHCERPMQPPEHFYIRILTSTGFTTRQRLASALAYANWLEHSGLQDAAGEMLQWAVDIAKSPAGQSEMLKPGTYILDTLKHGVSANLLQAVTAYGVHEARAGDVNAALPILLSVLKARLEAPFTRAQVPPPAPKPARKTDIDAFVDTTRLLFTPRPYPSPPDSGDEAYSRPAVETCEDAELMLYVGELMFALTPRKSDGLAWTKRAVDLAEQQMGDPSVAAATVDAAKVEITKCRQCLSAGIENWRAMLQALDDSGVTNNTPPIWSPSRWVHRADVPKYTQGDIDRLEQLRLKVLQNQTEMDAVSIRQSKKFAMFAG